jgi:hypothetical protein
MSAQQQAGGKIRVGFKDAAGMLWPYLKSRILAQVKVVALIIAYLVGFQTLVLGIPVAQAALIAAGLSLVILGLTFFMEGLVLGLMPLGEVIGLKLPQKSRLPVILVFAFILGVGATFAEPAIGVLKAAGTSVKAWDAPLLFLLLNRYPDLLVYAVGIGVGTAVVAGMLRFLYGWSLKPFIYGLVVILLLFSLWAWFDPNMMYLTGLAWDCGGVTTGPVTVPLVLALGIGICRVAGSAGSGSGGFGVVTLASLFPIVTVMSLGSLFMGSVPQPMSENVFFSERSRPAALSLFNHPEELTGYALKNASVENQLALFGGEREKMLAALRGLAADAPAREKAFGPGEGLLEQWAALRGTGEQKMAVFGSSEAARQFSASAALTPKRLDLTDLFGRNALAAAQAIIPLSLFFLFMLTVVLRERLPRADEILLGLLLAVIGLGVFNIGIEMGLAKLGNQVGGKLPSSFTAIELTDQKKTINDFQPGAVQTAVTPLGGKMSFFFLKENNQYLPLPYHESEFNPETRQYSYVPTRGPLFGGSGGLAGILVVLLFAFVLGYLATLAEPALNALGATVEELTVGAFRKSLLMQSVAVGVGTGIAVGVAKIIWDIPLIWLLGPPYLLLLFITYLSTEEFVNIGWDSAGVTTGPITVPLVLAMGLGISGQVGVVEGFGILAMASVCPILSVLGVGLIVNRRRSAAQREAENPDGKGVVA